MMKTLAGFALAAFLAWESIEAIFSAEWRYAALTAAIGFIIFLVAIHE